MSPSRKAPAKTARPAAIHFTAFLSAKIATTNRITATSSRIDLRPSFTTIPLLDRFAWLLPLCVVSKPQIGLEPPAQRGAVAMIFRSPQPDVSIPEVPLTPFVLQRAGELGDKPALIDGPTGRTLSFAHLAGAVRKAAGGLARRGFRKGDVFAIF